MTFINNPRRASLLPPWLTAVVEVEILTLPCALSAILILLFLFFNFAFFQLFQSGRVAWRLLPRGRPSKPHFVLAGIGGRKIRSLCACAQKNYQCHSIMTHSVPFINYSSTPYNWGTMLGVIKIFLLEKKGEITCESSAHAPQICTPMLLQTAFPVRSCVTNTVW